MSDHRWVTSLLDIVYIFVLCGCETGTMSNYLPHSVLNAEITNSSQNRGVVG